MASEFERRIAAAANRKSATRPAGAGEHHVMKAAIADWHGRIGPMIEQAVALANQQLADSGIRLKISKDIEHSIKSVTTTPAIPMRPVISIFSEPMSPPRTAFVPRIRIGLQQDARVFVAAHHCSFPDRPSVDPAELDKTLIRTIVADYVDAIVARSM